MTVRFFTDREVASPRWADLLREGGIDPEQPYDTEPAVGGVRIVQPSQVRRLEVNPAPVAVVDVARCVGCGKRAPWCSCGKADYR